MNIALAALLSACGSMPQTAQEFREAVPTAFMGEVQHFEANRPFREVAKTFQAKAPECLNVRVSSVMRTSSTSYQNVVFVYRPTVLVSDKKAELHVQRSYEKGVVNVYKEPGGGHYVLVADATPLDRGRTRIDIYGPSSGFDTLIRAIKGWATGQNVGCPDMTKG
jgi:hypothetical protein